jgi:glycosyltransferase involved in cell wall biosynthesis
VKNLVIIPAYNEEEALPKTLAALQPLPDEYEVVIVNDGSQDRTAVIGEELRRTSRIPVHLVNLPLNSGIGVAVQTGYRFAARRGAYQYAIQFDADGQHEASDVPALVEACKAKGLDLCVGSRFLESQPDNFRSTALRRIGIRFFSWLIRSLSGVPVTDPTSGFRCAGPRAWRSFAERYPDDYPEPESLYWCMRNGLRVGEVPVRMHARKGGVSSIRQLRSLYYMVKVSLAILIDRLRAREGVKP